MGQEWGQSVRQGNVEQGWDPWGRIRIRAHLGSLGQTQDLLDRDGISGADLGSMGQI